MIKKVSQKKHHSFRVIDENFLSTSIYQTMLVAGYTRRNAPMSDWLREEREGRFHLKKFERKKWELHYDLYGEDCDHYSIRMPYKCTKEVMRITSISRSLKLKHQKK